ncbi:MAG: hypothetical protein ACSI46_25005 [Gloeotrichia echinulata DVL01]|jgi:hypothetical protein
MSKYIVAIGGTGARVVQAVIHLAAAGLLKTQDNSSEEEIRLLFIEPDQSNGNLSSTTKTIQNYQKLYDLLRSQNNQVDWIANKIVQSTWSLFENANQRMLKEVFDQSSASEAKYKYLLDVLFTQAEQEQVLDTKGFRGRPAIGAAVMKQLIQNSTYKQSWQNLCNQIKSDSNPKVILCGSVFGGTGASGLPLIAQELKDLKKNLKLDALLVLPYFTFQEPENEDTEIFVRSKDLTINTKVALEYYNIRAKDLFDKCYLLGTPEFTKFPFSEGGPNQKNPPHFIELYAALAVRDSLFGEPREPGYALLLNRQSSQQVNWGDIPEREQVERKILTATIFALIWLIIIEPELKSAQNSRGIKPVHIAKFYKNNNITNEEEKQAIEKVSDWCKDYWDWLVALHENRNGINLVPVNEFITREELNKDKQTFTQNILKLRSDIKIPKIIEQLSKSKVDGQDNCTVKLAVALYQCCQPRR